MTIVENQLSITCPRCGMTSHNKNDVEQKYCGNCHWWTSDDQLAPFFDEVRRAGNNDAIEKIICIREVLKEVITTQSGIVIMPPRFYLRLKEIIDS